MTRNFSDTLRITEIFYSIQGESLTVGLPTVFVRLTGCPLRCQYCDTAYAFAGGQIYTLEQVIKHIQQLLNKSTAANFNNNQKFITLTGGEPLAQRGCSYLITQLCDLGYNVSIETSGAMDISLLDPRLMIVMDLKTPDSLEEQKNLYTNIQHLKHTDQIKFVICSDKDYEWAKEIILTQELYNVAHILLSPSYGQYDLKSLADRIVADSLPVRLQTQLHKQIWGDEKGR